MRSFVLTAALMACSGAAAAQTQPAAVDPAGAARGVAQIAAPRGQDTAMDQISPGGRRVTASGQLSAERGLRAGPQLNRGGRTAEAPASLSTPAQGRRPTAAVPIGGADRCDPGVRPPSRPAPDCARVLEARSAEFERAEAPSVRSSVCSPSGERGPAPWPTGAPWPDARLPAQSRMTIWPARRSLLPSWPPARMRKRKTLPAAPHQPTYLPPCSS